MNDELLMLKKYYTVGVSVMMAHWLEPPTLFLQATFGVKGEPMNCIALGVFNSEVLDYCA